MPQTATFSGLGWKVKIQKKGSNAFLTLAKEVLRGNLLSRGDSLYYYLIDLDGRKGLVVLLDKKPLDKMEKVKFK